MSEYRGLLYYSPRRGIAQLLNGDKPTNLEDILLKLDGNEIIIMTAEEYLILKRSREIHDNPDIAVPWKGLANNG